jgi:cytoskeletal protein CcmA (bactofilin family)
MVFTRKPEPKSLKIAPPSLTPEQQQASAAPNGPEAFGTHAVEDGSVIGNDLSIEGDSITMRCKGTLRVNGSIEANLHCQDLLVGDHAVIVGSITAARIAVSGRVNGAIYGDSVVLHPTAQVDGDIHSRSLTIEDGARFDGRSRKVMDPNEVAPQLEPPKLTPVPQPLEPPR